MLMALIVSSILSTCPCLTPLELALPKPMISSLPNSFFRPAIAAIFVVPISSPTIMGCCSCCISYPVFSCCIEGASLYIIQSFVSVLTMSLFTLLHSYYLSRVSYIQLLVYIHSGLTQHLLIKQQQPFKFLLVIGTITKLYYMVAYHGYNFKRS